MKTEEREAITNQKSTPRIEKTQNEKNMETIWAGAYVRTHEVKLQDKGQQETLGAETRSINEHLAGRERFTHPGVRLTNPEPATAPFPDSSQADAFPLTESSRARTDRCSSCLVCGADISNLQVRKELHGWSC